MDNMNSSEVLLRAILELIEKSETIEELRISIQRIFNGDD